MTADVHLTVAEATTLGERALGAIGFEPEQAKIITAHLVDAALCGHRFAGLPRILTIHEDPRTREPRTPVKVVYETEVSALMDGGNNVGYYAVHQATQYAIEKARKHRIAVIGMHRSHLSGRNAYYLEMIARAGFVGIHLACGEPVVLPHGGAQAAFGTNPIGFGMPTDGDPFIVDLGTAAMMRGEVILRSRTGKPLPEGTAIDGEGRPTTDPAAALAGGIFTFGGHRSSALSFGIQAMCLLAGAARARAGAGLRFSLRGVRSGDPAAAGGTQGAAARIDRGGARRAAARSRRPGAHPVGARLPRARAPAPERHRGGPQGLRSVARARRALRHELVALAVNIS